MIHAARQVGRMKISDTLQLPLAAFVTSTQAILAQKGSGKSYAASVQAEELLLAGQQIVCVDPTGAWFGLRSKADGSAGFPIAVIGGDHGDIPLEPTAGEILAEAVVAERFSCVIDLSALRKGQANRFVGDFLETLFRRNREAMHVFLDEADLFSPQRPFGDEARTLGATEDVVRRGRRRGIGCTLITQRPQVLSKNVLSQIDMLTCLRMNHPKDLAAIREWVEVHASVADARSMIESLPSLPIGDAWLWAPASDLFERTTVRKRLTFDSGRTPRAGERAEAPRVLAPVNIARLGKTIAATVERVKENDPKVLKVRVAELERLLASKTVEHLEIKVVEKPVLTAAAATELRELLTQASDLAGQLRAIVEPTRQFDEGADLSSAERRRIARQHFEAGGKVSVRAGKHEIRVPVSAPGDPSLPGGERKILSALAQYPGGRTKQQVAILTGYAHNGGGFSNYVSALRSRGLIEGDAGRLVITDAGVTALGLYDPLPTGRALFEHWHRQLGKAEREILRVLFEDWPKAHPKDFVALKAGYQAGGGGFNNALSRLRTLELIEGKAKIKASDQLQDQTR